MYKKRFKIRLLLQEWGFYCFLTLVSCLLAACDEGGIPDIEDMLSANEKGASVGEALQITDYTFSNDFKNMELSMRLQHDVGGYDLTDSATVMVKPLQRVRLLPGKFADESQPTITGVTNISREALQKLSLKLLVMVDLSLPQHQVDAERDAVKEIKALFGEKNLFIAFMQGDNVTETYGATDYVIDNYFEHKDPTYIYLYRAILTKLAEFQDTKMTLGDAEYKVMVILSGGKTYDGDQPVDPMHFELQQLLADRALQLEGNMLRLYYGSFALTSQNENNGLNGLSDLNGLVDRGDNTTFQL